MTLYGGPLRGNNRIDAESRGVQSLGHLVSTQYTLERRAALAGEPAIGNCGVKLCHVDSGHVWWLAHSV